MNHLFKTHLGRLRIIALLEGWSLLLLLFIAMPVKYIMGIPEATQAIGLIHGVLFVLFMFATLIISVLQKWNLGTVFVVMASSFVPFGTFYIDRKVLRKLPC
jgi:integral membrane protein